MCKDCIEKICIKDACYCTCHIRTKSLWEIGYDILEQAKENELNEFVPIKKKNRINLKKIK